MFVPGHSIRQPKDGTTVPVDKDTEAILISREHLRRSVDCFHLSL
jgi:hypothetical protein